MKFIEEFPSFKGDGTKGKVPLEMTTAEYIGRLVTEVPFRYKEGCGPTINLRKEKDIQKHCIDKQIARDAIDKLESALQAGLYPDCIIKFRMRLGLEE